MALTRDFRETVMARAQRDTRFRQALFTKALNAYLAGDAATGKAMLRDLINATIGFEGLAAEVNKPSKSLHRMLGEKGNPGTENFFGIVSALQRRTKVRLEVTARQARSRRSTDQASTPGARSTRTVSQGRTGASWPGGFHECRSRARVVAR